MLRYRLIVGPLMLAALLAVLWLDARLDRLSIEGTPWQTLFLGRTYLPAGLVLLLVFLLLVVLGSRELRDIFRAKAIDPPLWLLILAGWVGCLAMYIIPHRLDASAAVPLLATLIIAVFLASVFQHGWARKKTDGAVAVAGAVLFTMMYTGILPGFFLAIRRWHSPWVIAAIILVIKCCDIGAYFAGRYLGTHRLIPWLSPKKTWEGLIGGVALASAAALALAALLNALHLAGVYQSLDGERTFVHAPYPLLAAAAAGALFGLVGQFGDLIESLFKRDAGLKDSGHSIPGFGGILDVVDSPLVVAPVAYWLLAWAATTGSVMK